MPRGDGTGPMGTGPRGMGMGRGFGRRSGRGLGICRNLNNNPETKLVYLQNLQKEISAQIELLMSAK